MRNKIVLFILAACLLACCLQADYLENESVQELIDELINDLEFDRVTLGRRDWQSKARPGDCRAYGQAS